MLPDAFLGDSRPPVAGWHLSRLNLLLVSMACSGLLALSACIGQSSSTSRTGIALSFQRKFDLASCRDRCHSSYSAGSSRCSSISHWNVREKVTCIRDVAAVRFHCEKVCLKRKASCLGVWARGSSKRKVCAASCYKHMDNTKINACIEKECDAKFEKELADSGCEAHLTTGCKDTRAAHHYLLPGTTLRDGLPSGYLPLGSNMTKCELFALQRHCVDAINSFRAGRPFSDGRTRDHGELPLLELADPKLLQCSNEKALSDLKYSNDGKGCGHHSFSLDCGLGRGAGSENSCCTRHCSSFVDCKETLSGCLQSMWDEGQKVLDTGDAKWSMATGHYHNMLSESKSVSCGFGFDNRGRMLATQQFSR